MEKDMQVRLAAFQWLSEQVAIHGETLPRTLLAAGFTFQGTRVPLIAPQGIFKPRIMQLPLTITTSPNSPYDDSFGVDDFLQYRYRGSDPLHRDNVGLRRVFEQSLPMIYLAGIVPGSYLPVWPVYIIGDDPVNLMVRVAVDDISAIRKDTSAGRVLSEGTDAKRAYLTAIVRVRLHQQGFRERVLRAYRSQCAFCRLKHRELLDAAHIIPDHLPQSQPTVDNGLALCKLHHAAYDSFIIGVRPDFQLHVRQDVLEEEDGPILQHGLKNLHNSRILLPGSPVDWPNCEYLDWKYEQFLQAA